MSDTGASGRTGPIAALVLAGGASRRMGRDKALVEVDGVPLGRRVRVVLEEIRGAPVVAVGGDEGRLRSWGYDWVGDRWPGEGPLGGLVTGLDHLADAGLHDDTPVLVVAIDLPWLRADRLAPLVDRLRRGRRDAVVPRVGDREQVLVAAYRLGARRALEAAFVAGERSPTAALRDLDSEAVEVEGDDEWLRDVDTPEDLSDRGDRQ